MGAGRRDGWPGGGPGAPDRECSLKLKSPQDATSVEAATSLLPLVTELQASGGFHPGALVIQGILEQPLALVGRCLVPWSLFLLLLAGPFSLLMMEVAIFSYVALLWPLWALFLVGAWRDTLEGGRSLRIPNQLLRWGGCALRALPVLLVDLALLWVGSILIWVGLLDSPLAPLRPSLVALLYLAFSLSWGFFVAELVLRRRWLGTAFWSGQWRTLALLMRAPLSLLRWIRRPLRAGRDATLPLMVFLWMLVFFSGLLFLAVAGSALEFFLPLGLRFVMPAAFLLGGTLGLDIGVGVLTLNQLAALASEEGEGRPQPQRSLV